MAKKATKKKTTKTAKKAPEKKSKPTATAKPVPTEATEAPRTAFSLTIELDPEDVAAIENTIDKPLTQETFAAYVVETVERAIDDAHELLASVNARIRRDASTGA